MRKSSQPETRCSKCKAVFKHNLFIFLLEFVGTMILTVFFRIDLQFSSTEEYWSGKRNAQLGFLNYLFAYWIVSYLAFECSGAQFNPAMTLAMVLRRNRTMGLLEMLFYWLTQFLGALTGALLAWFFTREASTMTIKNYNTDPTNSYLPEACFVEAFFTFLFILVILI